MNLVDHVAIRPEGVLVGAEEMESTSPALTEAVCSVSSPLVSVSAIVTTISVSAPFFLTLKVYDRPAPGVPLSLTLKLERVPGTAAICWT